MKKSKNAVSIKHLKLACRHVREMRTAGITKNLSIRTLDLFSDVYAKLHTGGSASPHHISQVKLWSKAAKKLRKRFPNAKAGEITHVEHGTPRRGFADKVLVLYGKRRLNKKNMNNLVKKYWKLAVITLEEDRRLNALGLRSKVFSTPEKRWAEAGIKF